MADDERVEVEAGIPDAEAVRMGAVLAEFVQLEGWTIFKGLQERAANDIARKALRDESFSKREARGYLKATEDAVRRVERLIERHREHRTDQDDSRSHDDEIYGPSRHVTGSLADE